MQEVRDALPELPWGKRDRFVRQYELSHYDAGVLADDVALSRYFKAAAKEAKKPKAIANYVLNDFLSVLGAASKSIDECPIAPAHLQAFANLVEAGKISSKQAKEAFAAMFSSGSPPPAILA